MFLGNHCKFQWFWRDHCKFSMVFEETITIECFLGGLTIAINGFTMVFWCCYHRFQWFSMVPDHWSNDAMVSMDRCGLTDILTDKTRQWSDLSPIKINTYLLLMREWLLLVANQGWCYLPILCSTLAQHLLTWSTSGKAQPCPFVWGTDCAFGSGTWRRCTWDDSVHL